ncbi:hypothetical protein [Dyella mobilis]|uniref:Uncharacterized protein n=1 Tax=Dyella mobilis TaxID=1849582 RepID=A0ABS2KES4_9GAMM|nr:hypothetical protein [Dyella mobilis]MBM7129355.1 hypothetical protein [Dyella mobilis]GLQ98649.1 hypothetical protein GCM10007863_30690 [Dyella mobilis]
MAEPDHTSLSRLSGLPDHLFTHLPGAPPDGADMTEDELLELHSAIAGIEDVKHVITCLLADSDAFREVLESGRDTSPRLWPLPAMVYGSLLVAIRFLDECALMLRRDAHG